MKMYIKLLKGKSYHANVNAFKILATVDFNKNIYLKKCNYIEINKEKYFFNHLNVYEYTSTCMHKSTHVLVL